MAHDVAVEREDHRVERDRRQQHGAQHHRQRHHHLLAQPVERLRVDDEDAFEITGDAALRVLQGHEHLQHGLAADDEFLVMPFVVAGKGVAMALERILDGDVARVDCFGNLAPLAVVELDDDEVLTHEVRRQGMERVAFGLGPVQQRQTGTRQPARLGGGQLDELIVDLLDAEVEHDRARRQGNGDPGGEQAAKDLAVDFGHAVGFAIMPS